MFKLAYKLSWRVIREGYFKDLFIKIKGKGCFS